MSFNSSSLIFISVLLVSVWCTGCSSIRPMHSGRQGLFDGNYTARRSVDNRSRKPAAREVANIEEVAADLKGLKMQWPLREVALTSQFGDRDTGFHEGIDLRARVGTPIYAMAEGSVLYADKRISGYGRMIVLKHKNGFSSVYAHNSRLLVHKGQKVRRGQKIALAGATGHVTGPHLHFEVRKGAAAIDPNLILPKNTAWIADAEPKKKPFKRILVSQKSRSR